LLIFFCYYLELLALNLVSRYKKIFGNKGENYAQEFLTQKGLRILGRNFRIWGGEIDIIAKDLKTKEIVFVEVKTRSGEDWMEIDEALNKNQIRFIKRAGKRFLYRFELENESWRVDFVGILLQGGVVKKIVHFLAI